MRQSEFTSIGGLNCLRNDSHLSHEKGGVCFLGQALMKLIVKGELLVFDFSFKASIHNMVGILRLHIAERDVVCS